AVAREPERGLPDGALARAGPDRPRSARPPLALARRSPSPLDELRGDARPVLAGGGDDLLALALRDPAPDVVGRQRDADRAGATGEEAHWARHGPIVTSGLCLCRCCRSCPCSGRAACDPTAVAAKRVAPGAAEAGAAEE